MIYVTNKLVHQCLVLVYRSYMFFYVFFIVVVSSIKRCMLFNALLCVYLYVITCMYSNDQNYWVGYKLYYLLQLFCIAITYNARSVITYVGCTSDSSCGGRWFESRQRPHLFPWARHFTLIA